MILFDNNPFELCYQQASVWKIQESHWRVAEPLRRYEISRKFIHAKFPILANSRKLIQKVSRFFQLMKVASYEIFFP